MSYDIGTARGRVVIDPSGAVAGAATASNAVRGIGRSSIATSTALMTAGRHMTIMGGLAVAGFGLAVNAAAGFEKELSNFKAISEATDEQMEAIRQTALRLGRDTSFSANEAAQAISELSKAGLNTRQILNGAADAAVYLAEAGGIDIPTAAVVAASAMNTFNIAAEDMMSVADNFAGTANRTATDVEELADAIKYAGASASTLNIPLEDVNTALGILANRGLRGSIAGTNLNRMLINLNPSSDKAAEAMRELGIITEDGSNRFFDQEGRIKSLADVSQILQDSTRDLTDEQKLMALETIFGSRALQAATALAEEGAVGFRRLKREIGNVSAEEVSEEKLNNLSGSIEILRGSIETFLINAGAGAQGPLKAFVDQLVGMVNVLAELNPTILQWGLLIFGAAGAVFLMMGSFTYAIGAIMKFKIAMTAVSGVLGVSVGWIALIVIAIAALVAGFIWAYNNVEWFRDGVQSLIRSLIPIFQGIKEWAINAFRVFMDEILPQLISWGQSFIQFMSGIIETVMSWGDEISEGLSAAISGITSFFDWIVAKVGPVVEALVDFFSVVGPKVASVFKAMLPIVRGVFDALKNIITTAVGVIIRAWNLFGDNIVEGIKVAFTFVRSIAQAAMNILRGIIQLVTGLISGDWSKAWEGIKAIFSGVWGAITAIFAAAWGLLRNAFFAGLDAIRLVWHETWNVIKSVFSAAWQAIRGLILAGWNVIQGIWHGALNFLRSMWNAAWRNIGNVLRNAWNGIKSGVSSGITAVVGFLRGLPGRAIGAISSLVGMMLTKGREFMNSLRSGISGGFNAVRNFIASIPGRIVSALGNVGRLLLDAGRDIIGGLVDGIREALPSVSDVVGGIGGMITSLKGPPEYDKVMLTPHGQWIMEGLMKGITNKMPELESLVKSIAPTMAAEFLPSPTAFRSALAAGPGSVDQSVRHGDTYQVNTRTDADPEEIMDSLMWMSAVKV